MCYCLNILLTLSHNIKEAQASKLAKQVPAAWKKGPDRDSSRASLRSLPHHCAPRTGGRGHRDVVQKVGLEMWGFLNPFS